MAHSTSFYCIFNFTRNVGCRFVHLQKINNFLLNKYFYFTILIVLYKKFRKRFAKTIKKKE